MRVGIVAICAYASGYQRPASADALLLVFETLIRKARQPAQPAPVTRLCPAPNSGTTGLCDHTWSSYLLTELSSQPSTSVCTKWDLNYQEKLLPSVCIS